MNKISDSIVTRSNLALLDVLQTPIWIFDIERMQMWWANRAALSLWDALSLEELINRDWICVSEAMQTRLQTYLQQFKQGKTVALAWTFYPKERAVTVRCTCSGIRIESGSLAMLVEGVTNFMECIDSDDPATNQPMIIVDERDITDRKRVEEQLQKYTTQLQQLLTFEAMLKRITDKVRDSLDESQILQTVVRELVLVLGVSCCNTALYNLEIGTSTICYEYATLNPGAQARVAQIANFPEVYQQLLQGQYCQFCSITPNPVRGRVAMLACPILDDQGVLGDLWLINHNEHVFNELEIRLVQQVANQCAIAIRQARLYQAATAQVEELQKLSQLKDDFLSTISHELRTPVSNMKVAIRMLGVALNQETALSSGTVAPNLEGSKAAHYLKILQNECDREINLINDLLDLQRLEAGAEPMVVQTIQLQEWLPRVVEPFQERAKHRQQILQVELCSNLPALVSDPASLERIVAELLNNACKYTPPGEHIAVTARVCAIATAEEMIQIVVSNSGVEIPVDELPRIFQKFYRVPSTDPWKQSGTGLGLALVQSLTEHLGGTIQVSSNAGKTIFTVELPVKPQKLSYSSTAS